MYQGQKWKSRQFQRGNRVMGLQKDLKSLRSEVRSSISERDNLVTKLVDAVDTKKVIFPNIEEYEKKLAEVNRENERFHISKNDQKFHDDIAQLNREIPRENKAHSTTTAFLETSINKFKVTKKEWDQKYKEDTKAKQDEVNKWKETVEEKKRQLSNLETKYVEYFEVVREYEIQKEIERLEKEQQEKENNAATRIQAWWKGCLVRKGLKSGSKKKNKKK